MRVTIEISDEVALQANRTGFSVQEFIMQAIQRYIHSGYNDLGAVTNYSENIDDVLYGNL